MVGCLSALPHRQICFSQRGYPLNTSSTRYITDPRHCPSFAILEQAASRTSLIRPTLALTLVYPYLVTSLLSFSYAHQARKACTISYLMTAVLARARRVEALLAIVRRGKCSHAEELSLYTPPVMCSSPVAVLLAMIRYNRCDVMAVCAFWTPS